MRAILCKTFNASKKLFDNKANSNFFWHRIEIRNYADFFGYSMVADEYIRLLIFS